VNLPAVGVGGFSPATFALSLFGSGANRFLNLELSALEADGKGKLVSSPRVVTADKTKALIEQGTEFPYQQATSSGATSVAFRRHAEAGSHAADHARGQHHPGPGHQQGQPRRDHAAGIAINTKHIRTQVLVENGGTVVIGGIFELTETENETKVPLLGDLPGVGGNLFKNRARTSNKQEMLVFITPKMLADRSAAR
jgi:type IV pilus assembly protein PilQ